MAEYIKREDALDAWYDKERYTDIEAIPSADVVERPLYERALRDVVRLSVERKKGKWEWNINNGFYYCSECEAISPREDQNGEYCDCPNFCPNCGADMRGET